LERYFQSCENPIVVRVKNFRIGVTKPAPCSGVTARALHSSPYSSIDVQPLVEPLRCQPHLTAFVSKFSPLLMAEGFVNLLGCVCGRGDIEVTNTGRSKIAFQIRDGDGVSFGGLAIGAAANEIAEYPEMAVVNLFGGNLTQAGSREESGMGG
jgi:hypothetical protein